VLPPAHAPGSRATSRPGDPTPAAPEPAPAARAWPAANAARVGKLTYQGSAELRWALYEAAQSACRPSSPDHQDYLALKARGLSHTRASLMIARKLARRSCHVLRELGRAAPEGWRRSGRLRAQDLIYSASPLLVEVGVRAAAIRDMYASAPLITRDAGLCDAQDGPGSRCSCRVRGAMRGRWVFSGILRQAVWEVVPRAEVGSRRTEMRE